MADIFVKTDVENLLKKKYIWFMGDSNLRGMYKDLIWLLEKNTLINLNSLRGKPYETDLQSFRSLKFNRLLLLKLEKSFMNDTLVKGGALNRGRNFREIRHYKNFKHQINIEFTFLTQCYSKDLEEKLRDFHMNNEEAPDVAVINSCLWDLTRWGPESVPKYKKNIHYLIKLLKSSFPTKTKVIWITTPPISKEPRGGFFIKQIEFLKHTLWFDVMEANTFVSREFILQGFDVLDIHYHLLMQIHRRRPDGIHWSPEAMRHITNLFLTHLSICWNIPLPGNFKSPLLKNFKVRILNSSPLVAPEENFLKANISVKNTSNHSVSKNIKRRNKTKGKKRDWNGNIIGQIDFSRDVFDYDYDYRKKKFKI